MEFHQFTIEDKLGKITVSVKKEFLAKCPNPEELSMDVLLEKHEIQNHFHNTEGPAFTVVDNNGDVLVSEYFIDSKFVDGSEREKIILSQKIKTSFDKDLRS